MNDFLDKVKGNLAAQQQVRQAREALRGQFQHREDYRLDADRIEAFLGNITPSSSYGMIVAGTVVKDDDHFRELATGRSDIDLEVVFDDPEDRYVSEVREWLLQFAQKG